LSTVFTYNGVSIPYPKTFDVSDESVYENGDYLYTRWSFRVGGVIFTGAYSGGEAPATALVRVEHYLEQPRKRLTYVINGRTVLDVAASVNTTGTGDCQNGPFPEVLSVVRVDGGAAIWVEFKVTAHVRSCPGGPTQSYLSNRWRESLSIDDECRTTRDRQGRIVLRSDFGADPDTFRGIVTPPIPTGFVRESSRYELTEDGLRIQYQFIDKEVYTNPSRGTFKSAATYRETCTNGATRFAEVQASVTGDIRSNRKDLLVIALSIAMQRLNRSGLQRSSNGRWLATGAFTENLYEPKVEVQLRAMLRPPKAILDGVGSINSPGLTGAGALLGNGANLPGLPGGRLEPAFPGQKPAVAKLIDGVNLPGKPSLFAGWGEVPFGSVGVGPPDPGIRGTAGLRLLAAALNDPCLNQAALNFELVGGNGNGIPVLLPSNPDPGATLGGGAGPTTSVGSGPPDPFFNPNGFLGVSSTAARTAAPRSASGNPTNFAQEVRPNVVTNPAADLATAPASDLVRGPEGEAVRPSLIFVVPTLTDLIWEIRPDSSGVYTDYRLMIRVEEDNQTAELPPQEADGSEVYEVAYVNLSKPTLRLIVEWSAERVGQPPENPAKDLGDPNAVYLRGSWNPGGLEIASDGFTFIFNTAGRYEYGFKRPKNAKYGMGVPPWVAELMGLRAVPSVYNTPNISGIWPGTTSLRQVANTIAPALPGVPSGEGVPGTGVPSLSGNLIGNQGTSLQDFLRLIDTWKQGQ
jgi:hypothetical protein